jgi:hypothetical protein
MDSTESSRLNEQPHDSGVTGLTSSSATTDEGQAREQARDAEATLDKSNRTIETTQDPPRLPPVPPFTVAQKDSIVANDSPKSNSPNAPSAPLTDTGAARSSPDQVISTARTPLRALDTSIEVPSRAVGRTSTGRRISRGFARFVFMALIAVLTGVAASSAWESHGHEARQVVRTWASSLKLLVNNFLSDADVAEQKRTNHAGTSTPIVQPQVMAVAQNQTPATAEMAMESVQQLKNISQDVALIRDRLEQLASAQDQMTKKLVSLQAVGQEIKQKMVSLPMASAAPSMPTAPVDPRKNVSSGAQRPAHPTVLVDWWISSTRNGVFVEGNDDIYEAAPGVPLPGLGKVERIVRQDGRWAVVTRKGIIVLKRDRQYFENVSDLMPQSAR